MAKLMSSISEGIRTRVDMTLPAGRLAYGRIFVLVPGKDLPKPLSSLVFIALACGLLCLCRSKSSWTGRGRLDTRQAGRRDLAPLPGIAIA